ncbi:MAG: MoaD/ThiS family protein [Planctomycetes bacterium]|nr:MoaD/ThiS family protein [Planctomycetota bacterium]
MVTVTLNGLGDVQKAEVDASRVAELLAVLRRENAEFREAQSQGADGSLITAVFINGEDVRFGRHLNTPLKDGDKVVIDVRHRDSDRVLKELYLTFMGDQLGQPLLYSVGKMFGVVVNIKGASITTRRGFAHIELEGPVSEVDTVIEWFRRNGVQIEDPAARAD